MCPTAAGPPGPAPWRPAGSADSCRNDRESPLGARPGLLFSRVPAHNTPVHAEWEVPYADFQSAWLGPHGQAVDLRRGPPDSRARSVPLPILWSGWYGEL